MSQRRRKPTTGYRDAGVAPVGTSGDAPPSAQVPGFLSFLSRGSGDSPFPKISTALGRGFVTVASSPAVLLFSFGAVFVAWIALVALGLEGPPGRLVNLDALPPISTYFDSLNAVSIFGFGTSGLIASMGFLLVRALVLAVTTGLVVQRLEGEGSVLEGARRGLRAYPVALAVNVAGMSLMIIGSMVLPFLGPGFGFLGSVLTLVAAIFFFAYATTASIRERLPILVTLQRSSRAALMPGSRHLLLCLLYVFLTLPILVALAPGGSILTVNPTIATWAYALLATVVHLTFLAAFAIRWIAVEPDVPDEPVKLLRR